MSESLFCKNCSNLLTNITTSDNFYFKCMQCHNTYQPEPRDTLRYSVSEGSDVFAHNNNILMLAAKDPVNPKAYRTCKKCKNEIAKQVRLLGVMKVINICVECNNQWFESNE